MSQDKRRVARQNPVKKAKRTGRGSGISADDVEGHRGGAVVPAVEESVWTCPFLAPLSVTGGRDLKGHPEALCGTRKLPGKLLGQTHL